MENIADTKDKLANRLARLKGQVEYPESWIPEPGATLVGEVVKWDTGTTDTGTTQEILVVRDQDGVEHSVWTWAAQLRYRLIADKETLEASGVLPEPEHRLARVGDFVAIHYRGKRPFTANDGQVYESHSYKVAIEKKVESDVDAEAEARAEFGF
jgi:hypothetical protein